MHDMRASCRHCNIRGASQFFVISSVVVKRRLNKKGSKITISQIVFIEINLIYVMNIVRAQVLSAGAILIFFLLLVNVINLR